LFTRIAAFVASGQMPSPFLDAPTECLWPIDPANGGIAALAE
jgi:hypothetical protein